MPGGTVQETMHVNIESLWSGGPIQDPTYNGGNKLPSQQATMAQDMQMYRQAIFDSSNGTIDDIENLMTDAGAYGSYAAAGAFLTTLNSSDTVSNYFRWLDLDEAVARTQWTDESGNSYWREQFCSNPAEACVQYVNSTGTLPSLTYALSVTLESGLPVPNVTCLDNSTLMVQGLANDPGMLYEVLAQVRASGNATVTCTPSGSNATISVNGANEAWLTWVGGTNYDMYSGTAAADFSFTGPDPHDALTTLLNVATAETVTYDGLLQAHISDYKSVMSPFSLDLGQTPDLSTPTDQLKAAYQTNVGNPYFEWLLFNYGRYLLASSARGTLPPNLQGKWVETWTNAWGADYHSNINIQMNHWFAEMTNMDVLLPLFNYIENTWAPRGASTAQILYNISRGWVTHDEMNLFGHTGMKLEGCAHAQQLIWQLFNAVEKGYEASGDDDTTFLEEVQLKRAQMDKGIHIGSWGQLQEWKVDMDSPTDTHRHLSHLIGLYPGYAIASYDPSIQNGSTTQYTKSDVLAAAETSLYHRGNGTGPDADAGWEKAWRAACWAQLANASEFYFELSYTIERNIAPNLFSMYAPSSGSNGIFQIDANFGYPAALLNGLLQAQDVATYSTPLAITILPALPEAWPSGSIRGARVRGGMTLDLEWGNGKPTVVNINVDEGVTPRPVEVVYGGSVVASFTTSGGLEKTINFS
ncbi:hypothetical protein EVJ58_g8016 [Rhodofomes roseus]|uniref:Uncharacterized protein n=1 Tax=Rhodofomes roseus TaxID=34475 RepID=A0A4Y9Y0C0_9APHY|nr:hypothetical protein EVJ58_g8016 [Rhodofomes roseus]